MNINLSTISHLKIITKSFSQVFLVLFFTLKETHGITSMVKSKAEYHNTARDLKILYLSIIGCFIIVLAMEKIES